MDIIQKKIRLVPYEDFEAYMGEANEISPDPKDSEYLALALKLNCSFWTNDKKLKKQDKVKIYLTEDLVNELKK